MSTVQVQEELEQRFSKSLAEERVLDNLLSTDYGMNAVADSIKAIEHWLTVPAEYSRKQARKDALAAMDLTDIVQRLFVMVLSSKSMMSLANASGILASSLQLEENKESIHLAAEVITVISLYGTGIYVLDRNKVGGTYYLMPFIELSADDFYELHKTMYMPPMVSKPKLLINNSDAVHVTKNSDSLILKARFNYHNNPISLDVINKLNAIPLSINEAFCDLIQENPTFDLDTIKSSKVSKEVYDKQLYMHRRNWQMHVDLSMFNYGLMLEEGNKFYIPYKVDKRGRIYAQGHYINPIGTSYKKAVLDLHHKEKVNVPKGFFA